MTRAKLTLTCALSILTAAAAAAPAKTGKASKDAGSATASAEADKAPAQDKAFTKEQALAFAERFVADQGYTAKPASIPKDKLAADPMDPRGGPDAVLAARQGSLEPKAVGARFDSDLWFVGFKTKAGGRIRGLRMDALGAGAKMVSQSMRQDWLDGTEPQPVPLTMDEAKAVAAGFVAGQAVKGVAKEPSKAEDHQPSPADGWEAWWVYFPRTAAKKGQPDKPGGHAVVSVHKLTRDQKWIGPEPEKPAPELKKAPQPKKGAKR